MKVVYRVYPRASRFFDDLVDDDMEYPDGREMYVTVAKDAEEWTPIMPDRNNRENVLEVWGKDELHMFQLWCAYRKGEHKREGGFA